jgi:hypothetical protein
LKFVLERASSVSGKVIDPGGKPVAGALLDSRRGGERFASASTNAAGEFTVTVPRDGTVEVVLTAMRRDLGNGRVSYDRNPPWRGELKGVSPGSEGLVMQLIAIPADRTLTVRVVDPGGEPVAGVHVFLDPRPRDRKLSPVTDEHGVARFDGLLARETRVSVRLGRGVAFAAPASESVVPDGQVLEFRLRRAVMLAGVVVDGEGKPVARAAVTVLDDSAESIGVFTDAKGRFAVAVAADLGRRVTVRFGVPADRRWKVRDNVDPTAGELTLVLEDER